MFHFEKRAPAETDSSEAQANLLLGWSTNSKLEPRYWLRADAAAGRQGDKDVFRVRASSMASHAVIVAQSGSGKSFLLGRLVEELLLATRARCVVLDPNADFRAVHRIAAETLWTKAKYNRLKGSGKLPTEATRSDFEKEWSQVTIRILSHGLRLERPYEQIQFSWPFLSVAFLAGDLGTVDTVALHHCHSIVRLVSPLLSAKLRLDEQFDPVSTTQTLVSKARTEDIGPFLQEQFSSVTILEDGPPGLPQQKQPIQPLLERLRRVIPTTANLFSTDIARYYFGKIRECLAGGILTAASPAELDQATARLEIVDLPSFPDTLKLLALDAYLRQLRTSAYRSWAMALERPPETDDRVPTFVVADEAHQLAPQTPRSGEQAALRESIRQLAAEGRKYGLFLILATQRPDKLDDAVVSECSNRAVMRIAGPSTLAMTVRLLGLQDISTSLMQHTLRFGVSRALLYGPWTAMQPQIMFTAARRTLEGGRDLRPEYWCVPLLHGGVR